MGDESQAIESARKRSEPTTLESKTFKDGAIYLYRRADYKKPTWFIRLKIPGAKGYVWKSSKTTDEHAAYRVAEDFYNQSLVRVLGGGNVSSRRVSTGIGPLIKALEKRPQTASMKYTINRAYQAAMASLPTDKKVQLRATQREWMKERDSKCAAEGDSGGSMDALNIAGCVLEKTTQRATELEHMRP